MQITTGLVRRLVDEQFPEWAGLPLSLVDPAGSDHVIHRLGPGLSVRLPRHEGAIGQAAKELEWLPKLAPHLPLAVPVPVAVGKPGSGYPWHWAVARWMDGEPATRALDSVATAQTLAGFLRALQELPVDAAPTGNDGLAARDRSTRAAIVRAADAFDATAMTRLWDAAVAAPGWERPPVWFHGDFHTGNLLTGNGRVSAVIDFGGLGAGDPAVDLMMAFTLMSARTRPAFRAALAVDDATWLRGRGWALSAGLIAYTAYAATDPHIAAATTYQITQALD
ncbi:aminoglycoside phosphotransferase family protein [Actinoplanes awajinensis]|uniref:aminoglycoside phosphotransferase family protein n=1 Tax=Actinoplanes awajinensis TaxID=135946 RepID=UPI000A9A31F8|nr:aminoglycoside phosphotransferase family protein [Actinoplanes awajinensis]